MILSEVVDQFGIPLAEAGKLPSGSELEQFYWMADRKANEERWNEEGEKSFNSMDDGEIDDWIKSYYADANWNWEERQAEYAKMNQEKRRKARLGDFLMTYIRDREENEDSSEVYFEDPKILGKTTLYRFTRAKPEEVMKNGFKGAGPERLGLTHHEATTQGDLSFAFDKDVLKTNGSVRSMSAKYGSNLFQFTVPYAVKVYHNTDGEDQIVFDVNTVADLTRLKLPFSEDEEIGL